MGINKRSDRKKCIHNNVMVKDLVASISVNPGELLSLLQMALFLNYTFVLRCTADVVNRRLPSLYNYWDIPLPAFSILFIASNCPHMHCEESLVKNFPLIAMTTCGYLTRDSSNVWRKENTPIITHAGTMLFLQSCGYWILVQREPLYKMNDKRPSVRNGSCTSWKETI